MMKKVLFIATSDIHIRTFHIPYLEWLSRNGFEVHLAAENRGNLEIPFAERMFHLPFPRNPFRKTNITSYRQLKRIMLENHYDLIHCHTPVPSMLTRLAARKPRKRGSKVLYTAHGYHFFRGGPLKNWLLYFPIEFILSGMTDGIVTINREDYLLTRDHMRNRETFYIKGIGVDPEKFRPLDHVRRKETREELGFGQGDFILLYIAEFIHRKNHRFIIEALPDLVDEIPGLKVVFAGTGKLLEESRSFARDLQVDHVIEFLGFRDDVNRLAAIADVGISSSRQEGLGLGLAEEMLCEVPVVATLDRGHKEMVEHGKNGFMFGQGNKQEFISFILQLHRDPGFRERMGREAYDTAQKFRIENSLQSMGEIYQKILS